MVSHRFQKVPIPYTRIRELNIWTLSNFLSVLRVILLPFIYLSLFQGTPAGDMWAIALMLLVAMTDIFDGWIARVRHTISSFGKIIDPIADKICIASIMVFLIYLRNLPVWLVVMVIVRDAAILLVGALLIRSYKIVFPSNIWGKLFAFSMALLIAAYTIGWGEKVKYNLQLAVIALLAASLLSYTILVYRYIRTHYRHQRKGRLFRTRKAAEQSENVSATPQGENRNPGGET